MKSDRLGYQWVYERILPKLTLTVCEYVYWIHLARQRACCVENYTVVT
jgi:hypothetical protein